MARAVALTGTPGTGKSAAARLLARSLRVVEVADLARSAGFGRGHGRETVVDLAQLVRAAERDRLLDRYDLVVGHLAHLLPVSRTIVLRCHPVELLGRLRRARRGTPSDRHENFVCEATDVVLLEAIGTGRPVTEVDTTGRSVGLVAREVRRQIALRPRALPRTVDWLSDPRVTEHLLDRAR